MAEITELRAYLKEVIGLGRNAEGTARANAITGQKEWARSIQRLSPPSPQHSKLGKDHR